MEVGSESSLYEQRFGEWMCRFYTWSENSFGKWMWKEYKERFRWIYFDMDVCGCLSRRYIFTQGTI